MSIRCVGSRVFFFLLEASFAHSTGAFILISVIEKHKFYGIHNMFDSMMLISWQIFFFLLLQFWHLAHGKLRLRLLTSLERGEIKNFEYRVAYVRVREIYCGYEWFYYVKPIARCACINTNNLISNNNERCLGGGGGKIQVTIKKVAK